MRCLTVSFRILKRLSMELIHTSPSEAREQDGNKQDIMCKVTAVDIQTGCQVFTARIAD